MPAVELSEFLRKVADEMRPGQLLHGEGFSLLDAMAAVEIGDPKMDSGMCKAPVLMDELLEGEAAPESLSGTQLLATMDELLCCEATWYSGHTLAQTVCTCYYILRLERVSCHPLLHTYCLAVKVLSSAIRSIVLSGMVSQEEDFVAHTYGLPIDNIDGEAYVTCLSSLEAMEELLLQAKGATEPGPVIGCYLVDPSLIEAFIPRLRFKRLLIKSFDALKSGGAANIEAARRMLSLADTELQRMADTRIVSGPPQPSPGFNPILNNSLMTGAPPRKMELKNWHETCDLYTRLLKHLQVACSVSSIRSYRQLKSFVTSYSSLCAGPIASSVVHLLLTVPAPSADRAGGPPKYSSYQPSRKMLLDDMGLAGPRPAPEAVLRVVDHAVKTARHWVKIMCYNRSVQRRKLRRSVEDWAALHCKAVQLDETGLPQSLLSHTSGGGGWDDPGNPALSGISGPISTWVEVEAARAMLSHLLLGWELELYAPREFCMIYWYSDYLLDVVVSGMRLLSEGRPLSSGAPTKGGKKKGRSGAAHNVALRAEALALEERELQVLDVQRSICQAFVRVLAGLRVAGLLRANTDLFNGEAEHFDQRFRFLQLLPRPDPLFHQQYAEAMETGSKTAQEMLQMANECFLHGRHIVDTVLPEASTAHQADVVAELCSLKKVAVHNLVALQVLSKLLASGGAPAIRWEFPHHPHFPIMSLKQQ